MHKTALIAPLMLLGACATAATQAPEYAEPEAAVQAEAEAAPFYIRNSMQTQVNPAIVAIWDVGNNAMDDSGGLDPALMSDERWNSLAEAAAKLAAEGERMAAAANIRAASPGNMATGEFEISMEDVQRYLDADQQGFRTMGNEFAQIARMLENAAITRDIGTAGDMVARMDTSCSVCHAQYWYAEAE